MGSSIVAEILIPYDVFGGREALVEHGRVFGDELQVWGYSMVAEILKLLDVFGKGERPS